LDALSVYEPGVKSGNRKAPPDVEAVVCTSPFASLVAVISAPTTIALEGSIVVPVIAPVLEL
jgi:hypothetical protein